MHYAAKDFSSNGKETIKAVKGSGKEMGQRKGFSKLDLEKLNKYYECKQEAGDGKGEICWTVDRNSTRFIEILVHT